MIELKKHGKISTIIIAMDVIGFTLLFVGAGLIRYAKDEITSVLGGFVLAGAVTIISLTRLMYK